MFEYLYFILALTLGILIVYMFFISGQGKDSKNDRILTGGPLWPSSSAFGRMMWGPLWPSIDEYFKKRGGLTRLEYIGQIIILILMLIALIVEIMFPTGK